MEGVLIRSHDLIQLFPEERVILTVALFRNFRRNIQTISFNKILLQIDLTIWTSSFIHCLSALEQEQK